LESCAHNQSVPTVLIIDDEPIICRLLASLVDRQGWRAISSLDPRQALEMLMTEQVSLVISDIQMPNLDGIKLVSMAKAVKPDVPILLMTGNTDRYTAEQAREAGADGFVTKPFRQPELVDRISKMLRGAAAAG
jgi:DNA-binding response OmpR family regulator